MYSHILQAYVYNLAEGHEYAVQYIRSNVWVVLSNAVLLDHRYINVPCITTIDEAYKEFDAIEGEPCRLVRVSHYLVNDAPVAMEVLKCKI